MELTTKTAEIAKILIERGETVAVGESDLYASRAKKVGANRFQRSSRCSIFE